MTTPAERYSLLIGSIDWLLANPDKQLTGCLAANKDGLPVPPIADDADSFCLTGRLIHDGYKAGHIAGIVTMKDGRLQTVNGFLGPIDLYAGMLYRVNDVASRTLRQRRLSDFRKQLLSAREALS